MKKIHILLIVLCAIQFCGFNLKASTDEENLKNIIKNTVEHIKQIDGSVIIESTKNETYYEVASDTSKPTREVVAKEVGIQANMSIMRVNAELYYSNNNSNYGPATNSCNKGMFTDESMRKSIEEAKKQGATQFSCSATPKLKKANTDASWMAIAKLPGGNFWCVDSQGASQYVGRGYRKGDKHCTDISKPKTQKKTSTTKSSIKIFPKDSNIIADVIEGSFGDSAMYVFSGDKMYIRTTRFEQMNPKNKGKLLIFPGNLMSDNIIDIDKELSLVFSSDKFAVVKKSNSLYQATILYSDYLDLVATNNAPTYGIKNKKMIFDIYIENNLVKKIVSKNISLVKESSSKMPTTGTYKLQIDSSTDKFPAEIISADKALSCEDYFAGTEYVAMCKVQK